MTFEESLLKGVEMSKDDYITEAEVLESLL